MKHQSDSLLRSLDAADATLSRDQRERAEATLERILATPLPDIIVSRTGGRLSRVGRLVLAAAAALGLVIGAIAVQGEGGSDAYASWTPTPSAVSGPVLDIVAASCRDKLDEPGSGIDMSDAKLVLAERRGDYVALLYHTNDPELAAVCLARNPEGSTDVKLVSLGLSGSNGPALTPPATGYTQGGVTQFADGGSISEGAVGDQVTGVVIRAGDYTVTASVAQGRYAAWWPGPAFTNFDGPGTPSFAVKYDLVLDDGTVIRDARPTLPR